MSAAATTCMISMPPAGSTRFSPPEEDAMRFKAAALQMCSGREPAANIDGVVKAAKQAAEAGAVYLQTPEMTTVIERDRDRLLSVIGDDRSNPALDAFRQAAREAKIHLHIGSMAVRSGDKAANRAYVIAPD